MRRTCLIFGFVAASTFWGCRVGPDYKRPEVPAPPQFRSGEPAPAEVSLGDAKWFEIFQDETLNGLIKEATQANYEVLIAAQRIIQAEGQYSAIRAGLFPFLGAQGSATRVGVDAPVQSAVGGFGVAAWELDLFGKVRRATEAARADVIALEENRNEIMQSLVAQVATAYFDLREYDAELAYVRESIAARTDSFKLVTARLEGGVANRLEVDQAQSLIASAQVNASELERAIEQTENLINFFLGKPPGPIERGLAITEQYQPPEVPAGLPSQLLERRPDLRAAEQELVAANARVGVAKAAFFPSINLTAAGGYRSSDFLGAFSRAGFAYDMSGVIDLPIFDAGRRRGNYKTAKAVREELLINYQRAVNRAFHDVSDSLVGYQKSKETRSSQELLVSTLRDQSLLANLRYRGGVSSYLEVLDTERERLDAEQQLARAQRNELTSLVQLYKALGGGWQ